MGSCNKVFSALFVLLNIIYPVFSLICSADKFCEDTWEYCCGVYNDECCNYSAYEYWWFWFIWFFVLIGIVSCGYYCVRRRRLRMRYFLIPDHSAPNYGTVVITPPPAYPATQHQITPTAPINQPQSPPQYQPEEKPPVYAP